MISRRGEEHVDATGTTALRGGQPMRPYTISRISSMSKPVTALPAAADRVDCLLPSRPRGVQAGEYSAG
jgi:hypothetical protein